MKQLERFITTRGDTFSGQAVGFFDAGPTVARGAFVLDRAGPAPKLCSLARPVLVGPGLFAHTAGRRGRGNETVTLRSAEGSSFHRQRSATPTGHDARFFGGPQNDSGAPNVRQVQ